MQSQMACLAGPSHEEGYQGSAGLLPFEADPKETRDAFLRLVYKINFGPDWDDHDIDEISWDEVYDSFEWEDEQLIDFSQPLLKQSVPSANIG